MPVAPLVACWGATCRHTWYVLVLILSSTTGSEMLYSFLLYIGLVVTGFDTIDCLRRLFGEIYTAAWRFLEVVLYHSSTDLSYNYTPLHLKESDIWTYHMPKLTENLSSLLMHGVNNDFPGIGMLFRTNDFPITRHRSHNDAPLENARKRVDDVPCSIAPN